MKYSFKLEINDPDIFELIKVELTDFKKQRSTTILKKTKKGFIIEIKAKDAVALRASLNSITQLLKVHEKVKEIK